MRMSLIGAGCSERRVYTYSDGTFVHVNAASVARSSHAFQAQKSTRSHKIRHQVNQSLISNNSSFLVITVSFESNFKAFFNENLLK